jgi:type III secretory pathway component EscT
VTAALAGLLQRAEVLAAGALLCGLRLLPAALLSPFLGGPAVPAAVRLALALGLGSAAAAAAGSAPPGGAALLAAAARELALGLALGLCAALPLEAARAAGRLADTLRGATLAELHAGPLRQRETALGDLLAWWAVVLAGSAGADRLLLASLLATFASLPPGGGAPAPALFQAGVASAAELAAAGLCLGAPAAAGVLCADLAIAAAARASPALGAGALAQPARAGLGLLAIAFPAAALGGRLVQEVAYGAGIISRLAGTGP